MKVLLIGGSGLLGSYLRRQVPAGVDLCATFFGHEFQGGLRLDTTKAEHVQDMIKYAQPDVVIHAAAVGSVDEAERDPLTAFKINVQGALAAAEATRKCGARFVHVSSNAVFGAFPPPYREDSPFSPANVYGRQKAVVDDALRGLPNVLIIRPILMYGWPSGGRGNWVTSCLDRWGREGVVTAVTDVLTQPLYAGDCATFLWNSVRLGNSGVYHVAGRDVVTIHEFTRAIAKVFQVGPDLVEKAVIADFPALAPRPSACWYVLDKLEESGHNPIGIIDGLSAMKLERKIYVTS